MAKLLVTILNGPNLNMLGTREPEIYGTQTLVDIEAKCKTKASLLGLSIDFKQSNHEGVLIDWIQEAGQKSTGLILNPGAYTHTSIAIHDALASILCQRIELHLSNVHAREEFRRQSHVSPQVQGIICGFGAFGYELALDAIKRLIDNS